MRASQKSPTRLAFFFFFIFVPFAKSLDELPERRQQEFGEILRNATVPIIENAKICKPTVINLIANGKWCLFKTLVQNALSIIVIEVFSDLFYNVSGCMLLA